LRRDVEEGLPITRHWRPPDLGLARRGYPAYVTHVPASYASLRLGSDDVAQALYPIDALAAVRWSRRARRPAIYAAMGLPSRDWLMGRRLIYEVLVRVTLGATAVTVLSRAAAAAHEHWFGVDCRVIAPGVDIDLFTPDPGARSSRPTIYCGAATDDPRKRTDLLVAAFARVRRQYDDARLLLIEPRDGSLAARMRETPGLELLVATDDPIIVRGRCREAWISVLASYEEAFGLVLAEGLACGTPVVGRSDAAAAEIIDRPEIGRTFAADDEEELAQVLLGALALNETPATAAACRARGEDYSQRRSTDAYLALYDELLEDGD